MGMFLSEAYINLDPKYIDAEIEIGTIPAVIALIPLAYHVPTMFVMKEFIALFFKISSSRKDETINPHVMSVILLHQLSTFCFMLADYVNLRIPATGLLTNWCASQPPSHLIKTTFWLAVYFNYLSMIFPFLLALLRLIPILRPAKHLRLSSRIAWIVPPLIFIYPLLFTWFMIPARGVCKQYPPPYKFGAVYFYFIDSWHNMKSFPFVLVNSTIWWLMCFMANLILYVKLRKIGNKGKSTRFQKAEFSLTLTTITLLVSYSASTIFLVIFGFFTPVTQYFVMIRPFANDCDAVIIPWIFFMVHPAFKNKSRFLRNLVFTPENSQTVVVRNFIISS